uniref:GDNF family receptor alpha like n=1 Tax=Scleropages formosus TaxID=113540 RepID=A0A8C9RVU2_SCLFO
CIIHIFLLYILSVLFYCLHIFLPVSFLLRCPSPSSSNPGSSHYVHSALEDQRVCGRAGGLCSRISDVQDCRIMGTRYCGATVQYMIERFPQCRGCLCVEGTYCSTGQLLNPQCITDSEHVKNLCFSPVPKTRGSCLSEMKVCIQDSVCNAQLSGLFKSCSEPGCDGVRCQRAARRFYDGLPLGVAEMLVFCACEPDDPQCLSVRADIQSPACPERPEGTRTRTCLEARDDCVKDPLCRKQYGTFQSKCLRSESIFCHAGESCFGPVDLDLILGSDFECRRAFFGTMGTVLHQPCTCDGLNSDDRHACLFFRSIFHDKSPFGEYSCFGFNTFHCDFIFRGLSH